MPQLRGDGAERSLSVVAAGGDTYAYGGSGQASLLAARDLMPEEYARLHTEIERASSPSRCFVVGVTSAVYGEGKTTVAMNLAATIAQNSLQRVALIDMNFRTRDLQTRVDIGPCAGLIDLVEDGNLQDLDTIVQATEVETFTIVPAGRRSGNPARLARSPGLAKVMDSLRSTNDFIVLDMAPVLPVTDTRIISRLADGVVMVVRAGVTPREIVSRAIDAVGEDRVLGVVLNGAEMKMPKWMRRYFGGAFLDF